MSHHTVFRTQCYQHLSDVMNVTYVFLQCVKLNSNLMTSDSLTMVHEARNAPVPVQPEPMLNSAGMDARFLKIFESGVSLWYFRIIADIILARMAWRGFSVLEGGDGDSGKFPLLVRESHIDKVIIKYQQGWDNDHSYAAQSNRVFNVSGKSNVYQSQ